MIHYKIATTSEEFESIYALNYQTFVEEIPQHQSNQDKKLVDKFDKENIYIIAKNESNVLVGMICIRDQRPFSIDSKMDNIDQYFDAAIKKCEIRLLAILPEYRKTGVFKGLIQKLYEIAQPKGYQIALISGTDRQQELYKHIGFEVFSDPIGTPEALFYPMFLSIEKISNHPFFA